MKTLKKSIGLSVLTASAVFSNVFAANNSDQIAGEMFGMLGGLGSLFISGAFLVAAIFYGLQCFRRGSFAEFAKKFGEGDRMSDQAANLIGTGLYAVMVIILLPIVSMIGNALFQ